MITTPAPLSCSSRAATGTEAGLTKLIGWGIEEKPVHVNDLHATMLHQFGLDHLLLTYRFRGRDFRLTGVGGKVILY